MQQHAQQWTVGDITVTCIVESQYDGVPPQFFFPTADAATIARQPWLVPTFAAADGTISMAIQALVVTTPTRTVVVDPCVGNGKTLSLPFWNNLSTPFLERFTAAGFDPLDVDLVVHTHLHEDHLGWDTTHVDGRWVPTFPNARHLYVAEALEALRALDRPEVPHVLAESIDPIFDAGLADLIELTDGGYDLGEGLRLVDTPGHMVGHVSLWIEPDGCAPADTVLVTGDFTHHPLQCAEPWVAEVADIDHAVAEATRRTMFATAAERACLVIGTHYPTAPAGHVVPHGDTWRFDPLPREV